MFITTSYHIGTQIQNAHPTLPRVPCLKAACLTLGMSFSAPLLAQTFEHPFFGDELASGERIARSKEIHSDSPTNSQHFGYDLTAARKVPGEDKWIRFQGANSFGDQNTPSTNQDWFINGQKVYAMIGGTVERCWRNGRSNLRPRLKGDSRADYTHPDRTARRLHAGGNFVQVRLENGNIMRYSHFQPGSIPEAICPNNAVRFSVPGALSETDVTDGAVIETGDFLGLVGNVGRSTNPHLHVHVEDEDGNPVEMKMRNGLASPVNESEADIDKWQSFAGDRIPPGRTLIWPRRRLAGEYTRARLRKSEFGRMFDHLTDSGFGIDWFDGYQVGDETFVNMIWTPATEPFRFSRDLNLNGFLAKHKEYSEEGFEPVMIQRYLVDGTSKLAVLYKKDVPGSFFLRGSLSLAEHEKILDEQKSAGRSPVSVSVTSVNGQPRYSVLYRSNDIGSWTLRSALLSTEYQALFEKMADVGKLPNYLKAYKHDGKNHFSVIFASNAPVSLARHNLSPEQLQDVADEQREAGKRTRLITGVDGATGLHRFAGTWN